MANDYFQIIKRMIALIRSKESIEIFDAASEEFAYLASKFSDEESNSSSEEISCSSDSSFESEFTLIFKQDHEKEN